MHDFVIVLLADALHLAHIFENILIRPAPTPTGATPRFSPAPTGRIPLRPGRSSALSTCPNWN